MKIVQLYTDGCALGNNKKQLGAGGAGAILVFGKHQKELKEFISKTTVNRAELWAIIMGLEALNCGCHVQVFSDSQVTVRCANGEYKRNANQDLWEQYESVAIRHHVELTWIRKDSHPLNRRAHELANEAARKQIA